MDRGLNNLSIYCMSRVGKHLINWLSYSFFFWRGAFGGSFCWGVLKLGDPQVTIGSMIFGVVYLYFVHGGPVRRGIPFWCGPSSLVPIEDLAFLEDQRNVNREWTIIGICLEY